MKRRNCICCDQFLLPTVQERGTSGNVSPTPSVNESEAQGVTSGHHVGEGLHAKDATCRQQKKRCGATYEESFIELQIILVKANIFNVSGTVVQKTEWRREIRCEDEIPKCYEMHNFCQPPYYVSNPP